MAPSVIFGKNTIADEILSPCAARGRPGEASLQYSTLFEVKIPFTSFIFVSSVEAMTELNIAPFILHSNGKTRGIDCNVL